MSVLLYGVTEGGAAPHTGGAGLERTARCAR